MPLLASQALMTKAMPLANPNVLEEFQKRQIAMALHQAFQTHSVGESHVACAANQQGLWAIHAIKKTQFKLVPLGPISKAKQGQDPKLQINHFGAKWAIGSFKQNMGFTEDHDGIILGSICMGESSPHRGRGQLAVGPHQAGWY